MKTEFVLLASTVWTAMACPIDDSRAAEPAVFRNQDELIVQFGDLDRTYADRDPNFVFFEIFLYPGRSPDLKAHLIERITYLVNQYTGVDSKNIHAVIHEIPPDDYFGGIKHQH